MKKERPFSHRMWALTRLPFTQYVNSEENFETGRESLLNTFNRKWLLVFGVCYVFLTIVQQGFIILKIMPLHISLALFVSERMLIVGQPMMWIKAAGIKRQRHGYKS